MKRVLHVLDRWAARMILILRPQRHKGPNVLTDDVHLKKRILPPAEDQEEIWKEEDVIAPDHYFVTLTGQVMRDPVKRKTHIKRYRVKK